jgi:hypothetical protein
VAIQDRTLLRVEDSMQARMLELMQAAIRRLLPATDVGFLDDFWHEPASRKVEASISTLAGHDVEFTRLLGRPEFARLRPLTAPVHTRLFYLAGTRVGRELRTVAAAERAVELLLPEFLTLGRRAGQASVDEALQLQSLYAGFAPGFLLHGRHFADHWDDIWKLARRRGLLDNLHIRMQLAILGSYVGRCGAHVDLLLDPKARAFDLIDTLFYVHAGSGEQELQAIARYVRGEHLLPEQVLPPERARATWRRLADFVRSYTRLPGHFSSEGSILMALSWVEEIARRAEKLRSSGPGEDRFAAESRQMLLWLKKIDSVQAIEKGRFWRVVDSLPGGSVKQRLLQLWSSSRAG